MEASSIAPQSGLDCEQSVYKVAGPTISFEDVLRLDGIDTAGQDPSLYDVDWRHGNEGGSLKPGQSVELQNGMRFDAGKSNRS